MYYIMYNFVLFVDIKQHFDYIIEKMLDDIELIHLMMEYHQYVDLLQIFHEFFCLKFKYTELVFISQVLIYQNKTLFL